MLAASVVIVIIILAFVFWPNLKRSFEYFKVVKNLSDSEAILILDFDGQQQEKQRWFKGSVVEGMTILQALQAASVAGGFDITANPRIIEINNVVSSGDGQWVCYLNSRLILENPADAKISPKDKIVCKYQ